MAEKWMRRLDAKLEGMGSRLVSVDENVGKLAGQIHRTESETAKKEADLDLVRKDISRMWTDLNKLIGEVDAVKRRQQEQDRRAESLASKVEAIAAAVKSLDQLTTFMPIPRAPGVDPNTVPIYRNFRTTLQARLLLKP